MPSPDQILDVLQGARRPSDYRARAGAPAAGAARGARRVQAAAQALGRLGRPRADPRQSVRAARIRRTSLPDVCRPIPPVSASSCPTTGRARGAERTSTSRRRTSPRRCTAIACSCASSARRRAVSKGASSGFSSARTTPSSGASRRTRRDSRTSCRSIVVSPADIHVPSGQSSRRNRTTWSSSRSRAGRRRHAVPSAASSRCSATSTSRASTRRSSFASTTFPTPTRRRRSRRRDVSARRSSRRDIQGRTDFRPVTTVTIDGEHARDFDDAITLERLPNGHYWLGVHIADVSHYVQEGSALDEEAYERGTSVYFTERAVHMFPVGAGDGTVQPEPARRSTRAVVPDGSRSPRPRRALRDARRRHQQRRANDLHGGQRDPDRPRSAAIARVPGARAAVRA